MTTEIELFNSDGVENESVGVEISPTDTLALPESSTLSDRSASQKAEENWESFKLQVANFFKTVAENTITLFNNNRQLFSALGWVILAFLGIKVLFAAINAIDDIPFVTFILKLIGFLYVVRFVQRYLVRADNRQELSQMVNHAKSEFLGSKG